MRHVGRLAAQPALPSIWISTFAKKYASSTTHATTNTVWRVGTKRAPLMRPAPGQHAIEHEAAGERPPERRETAAHVGETLGRLQQRADPVDERIVVDRLQRDTLFEQEIRIALFLAESAS